MHGIFLEPFDGFKCQFLKALYYKIPSFFERHFGKSAVIIVR
jgi:hypothetical protein